MVLEYSIVDNIYETRDLEIIETALNCLLEIPSGKLKSKIIEEILVYLKDKFSFSKYKISVNIAYDNSEIAGFVIAQIDTHYRSYGKKCATFGWLRAKNMSICRKLMNACEKFANKNNYRRIRGPINFPKGLGGVGAQIEGFSEKLFYGIAFNPPSIPKYLIKLGYKQDAEYVCGYVSVKNWNKGNKLDKEIRLGHLSLEEIKRRKDEILNIIASAFVVMLPDFSGEIRGEEIIEQLATVPKEYYRLPSDFNPRKYSDVPEFIEDWESMDPENVITLVHWAFNRKTGEIIGGILCLPDLYQLWVGEHITRVNVDTVFVKPEFAGKGIFSSLNNIGQLTCELSGVNYFEGTGIWTKNERAIKTIFPHTDPIRKHVVFQKRLHSPRK